MVERLWTIIRKEFIHTFRDIRTLSLIAFLPILMLLLLGYAVSNDIENIPLAVVDQSHTDDSRAYIDRFTSSNMFDLQYQVENETELLDLIDRGKVQAGLFIPLHFEDNSHANSVVQVYVDGSDPTIAQAIQLAFETIHQESNYESQQAYVSRQAGMNIPARMAKSTLKYLYNPEMRRLNFLIPALAAAILQVQTLLLTGFAIVREREQGTLEQLIVTPIQPWELILGKIIPFILIGFINLWVTLGLGSLIFGVNLVGSMPLLAVLSLLFIMGSLGLGILISVVARSQVQAMHIAMFINLPSLILSGFIFPRYNMPLPAFLAGYLLPLTFFIEIIRGIALKGVGFDHLWPSIWPLAVYSGVVFAAGVLLFRKRLE
jgi:ABC-2 type transport system permease protein